MSSLDREFLERIEEVATERLSVLFGELTAAMLGDDQLAYGDEALQSPAEFVLFYVDLHNRFILPHLVVIAPKFAERLRKWFERDWARITEVEREGTRTAVFERDRQRFGAGSVPQRDSARVAMEAS